MIWLPHHLIVSDFRKRGWAGVRRRRQAVIDVAARRGARNVRVFGSVACGEDTASSDVDLFVDLDNGVGLVSLAGLRRERVDVLGVDVDVVPASTLKPESASRCWLRR